MQSRSRDDLSPIPEGWSRRPLGELCSILSGGTPAKANISFWEGDIPWVSGKDMKSPRLGDTMDHISAEGLAAGSRLAPKGAVFLLVRGMGLAKDLPVAVAQRPMAFNQDIKALVPRTGLSGSFIRAAIYQCRDHLLSRIVPSAHGTMTLNLDDIETFTIPTPADVAEGNTIGLILDIVFDAIDHAARHYTAAQTLKRAAMRAIFTRGLRDEAQKETEIGQVPQSWFSTTLGTLCSKNNGRIQTGPFGSQLHSHEYVTVGVPVVNPTHLAGNKINHENVPRISEQRAKSLARHRLRTGDILFGRRGEIGRLGLVGEQESGWVCGTGCFLVRVIDPRTDNRFLAYFFSSEPMVAWLTSNAAGAIMPNLNNVVLGKVPVAVPSLDEQRDIVTILDSIDRKIELHRRKRAVLDEFFKALLHKLMTGEIRVADSDLSALAPKEKAEAAA